MANEVLFLGGRLDSVVVSGVVVESNTTSRFNSAYADVCITLSSLASYISHQLFTQSGGVLSPETVVSGETLFLHFEYYHGNTPNGTLGKGVEIKDSSGYPWLKLQNNISDQIGVLYNSGTGPSPVWTLIGTRQFFGQGALYTVDVELTLGSPHGINFYLNGSLIVSGTFTQASFNNVSQIAYGANSRSISSIAGQYSQLIATRGISTIGAKVKTVRATAPGANTGWSGSYASVNEVVGSDASLQNAASAGLKSTHAMGDVTVPSGFEIKSVFHWMRAKNDGTGPTNIKSVLHLSGIDYTTGNLSGISLGYSPVGARYDADPLGTNWTQTTWNAIEAGYEAAT